MPSFLAALTGVVYGIFALALILDVGFAAFMVYCRSYFMAAGTLVYGSACFLAVATGCAQGSQRIVEPNLFRVCVALSVAAVMAALVGAVSRLNSSLMEVRN